MSIIQVLYYGRLSTRSARTAGQADSSNETGTTSARAHPVINGAACTVYTAAVFVAILSSNWVQVVKEASQFSV